MACTAASRGSRVLVVSTDPAPSLSDAFGRVLGPEPRSIATRRGLLHGAEIDAPAALDRWLEGRRAVLERIALRGTWLDADDISRLLRLALPGIDELAALLEVSRLAGTGAYDIVIVDTAPTGHTLRMLDTPGTLRALAGVFDGMQAKHRVIVEALRGRWSPDAEDALIDEMADEGERLAGMLRNPARVTFRWITLPERMAIEETADAAAELSGRRLLLSDIIVNRITPAPSRRCAWCDARRAAEDLSVRAFRERLPDVRLIGLVERDVEPRGLRALRAIGAEMQAGAPVDDWHRRRRTTSECRAPGRPGAPPTLGTAETRLLLFGGKGGVGKTTCAAAAAIALARRFKDRRVLLLSTDPAHSLGDALGAPVSSAGTAIHGGPRNLTVREMDAAQAFRQARQRYATAIDGWFDRLSRSGSEAVGIDAAYDRRVMHGLMDLAPPGIDELTAVMEVVEAMDDRSPGASDVIVMDTAPSGHALRLLEMPALVHDWARALMSILLKYQPVAGVGELGAVLLRMSQGLGRLRALLTDPAKTSFIAVTRPAALPREETRRLLLRLKAMQVDVPVILVNAVGRGTCARCRAASLAQARELRKIERVTFGAARKRVPVVVAPAELPPPHGIHGLRRWHSSWRIRDAGSPIRW